MIQLQVHGCQETGSITWWNYGKVIGEMKGWIFAFHYEKSLSRYRADSNQLLSLSYILQLLQGSCAFLNVFTSQLNNRAVELNLEPRRRVWKRYFDLTVNNIWDRYRIYGDIRTFWDIFANRAVFSGTSYAITTSEVGERVIRTFDMLDIHIVLGGGKKEWLHPWACGKRTSVEFLKSLDYRFAISQDGGSMHRFKNKGAEVDDGSSNC